jgi:hypothetical protein
MSPKPALAAYLPYLRTTHDVVNLAEHKRSIRSNSDNKQQVTSEVLVLPM